MTNKKMKNTENSHTSAHGVLLESQGFGVLVLGPSGIGKSESAIELITKGFKLVSDDVVEVLRTDSGQLIGKAPQNIKHLIEVRGLGIINVRDIYGINTVLDECEIDMVIELARWDSNNDYDRLGIENTSYNLLGMDLPYKIIPVSVNRNISMIIEVAVRSQICELSNGGTESVKTKNFNTGS
jgi:HPr kinase/phosphorylase